jgi:hypothetical protein
MRLSTAAVIAFIAYTSTQAFAAPVNTNSLETRGWLQKRGLQEIEPRNMNGWDKLLCLMKLHLNRCKLVPGTSGEMRFADDSQAI